MRKLIALLFLSLLVACTPTFNPTDSDSYHPPTLQYDTTVARIHLQYDTYRSEKHNIPIELATLIRTTATDQSIPIGIAFSLVHVESRFDSLAISHAGAIGLSQVMPATGMAHCGLSPDDLRLVSDNLTCGFSYLHMLHDRLGEWSLSLASYNVGDARRRRAPLTGEPDGSGYATLILGLAS